MGVLKACLNGDRVPGSHPALPVTAAELAADAADAAAVGRWSEPDFASVNLSEPGHAEAMGALRDAGAGIEAGVWTVADVAALERSGFAGELVRVLIEPTASDGATATQIAWEIEAALVAAAVAFGA